MLCDIPSPTLLKLQLVWPLIFLRALHVLRFFPTKEPGLRLLNVADEIVTINCD